MSEVVYSVAGPPAVGQMTSPLWVEVPAALNSIVAAAALIIAGCFAYMRFARGRVLHAAVELGLAAKLLVMIDGAKALAITTTVTNTGSLRLIYPLWSRQSVTVYRADAAMWADAVEWGEVLWTEGLCYEQNILKIEGVNQGSLALEPGEKGRSAFLAPLPTGPCFAYRVAMHIEARPRLMWRMRPSITWETDLILKGDEIDV